MRYAYAYDAAGNITVKNTEHGNYAYGYDIVDRLTSATYPTAQEAFAYDKVGTIAAVLGRITPTMSSHPAPPSATNTGNRGQYTNEIPFIVTQQK